MDTKQKKPLWYLLHAFLVFALLGSEFLVFFLSRIVDGRSMSQLFSWPVNWYAVVFHWLVTVVIWGGGALFFISRARRNSVLSELIQFQTDFKAVVLILLAAVIAVSFTLVESRLTGAAVPQLYSEFLGFTKMYGNKALVISFFQNIYYLFEFVLVVLLIAFFQRAGELLFKAGYAPWGGLGLMLTWGSFHFLTNPQGALSISVWSVILGMIFVVGRKNVYPVYLLAVLGFIL